MKKELFLDCESPESTFESVAAVFGCSVAVLREFLSNPQIGKYYKDNCSSLPDFGEYLYLVMEKHFGLAKPLDAVCWFHTTRVPFGTSFSEGILPLGAVLPKLKKMLVDLVDDDEIREILRDALNSDKVADNHYQNKTTDDLHWGPYAILVKEVAFRAGQLSQHDYLGMPEIIEDICSGIGEPLHSKLILLFKERLVPTIVKFKNINVDEEQCISTALCYLLTHICEGKPDTNSVYCFDGDNVPVLPIDIIKVEHLS